MSKTTKNPPMKKDKSKKRNRTSTPKPPSTRSPTRISAAHEDAETEYPLSEWLIPATDSHGHSAKLFTRVPPSYKHQITLILNTKRYPWETESDFARVAIHRLCDAVAKDSRDPEMLSQQALLNSMMEMASRQMEYLHFKETMDKLSSTLSALLAAGAEPMVRKVISGMKEQIAKFEEEYWRERFQKELYDRFSDLLSGKKNAGRETSISDGAQQS